MLKNKKGVTLIALIITIIILLILAGITFNSLLGSNGLLNRTGEARETSRRATENEENTLEHYAEELDKSLTGGGPLGPQVDEDGIIEQFNKSYGVIDVVWLDTNNNVVPIPEAPILSELTPVKWTGTPGSYSEQVGAKNDPSSLVDWYEYVAGSENNDNNDSRWANGKAVNGSNIAYFVWIPRYAYRITYFDTQAHANEYRANGLSVIGIIGYSNIYGMLDEVSGKVIKDTQPINVKGTVKTEGYKDYIPHPAFEFDGHIKGFWVGKYQNSNSVSNIRIVPNVATLRNLTLYDQKAVTGPQGVSGTYTLNGDTHLTKNIEWGAVAYLTESKFGRNGTAIYKNNNTNYMTGQSSGETEPSSTTTSTANYNTKNGVLASSTGNVYGIYDLSGPAYECVMGAIGRSTDSLLGPPLVGGGLGELPNFDPRYCDIYYMGGTQNSNDTYMANKGIRGDCVYETSNNGSASSPSAWHNQLSYCPLGRVWGELVYKGAVLIKMRGGQDLFHSGPQRGIVRA